MSTPPPYPDQPQYPLPGYPQPGYAQQPGYPQQPQPGHQQPGYQQPGFPAPQQGFPPQLPGFPPSQGFPQQPYPQQPYPQQQYPQQQYPQQQPYPQQQYPQPGGIPQIGLGPGRAGGFGGFSGGMGAGPASVKIAQTGLIVAVVGWAVVLIINLVAAHGNFVGGLYLVSRLLILGLAIPARRLRTGQSWTRIVATVFGVLYIALLIFSMVQTLRLASYVTGLGWLVLAADVVQLLAVAVAIVFLYRPDSNYFFRSR
ncbi:MAG TPA: hypothetical protein VG756_13355 [Pseudonocardiaceae bacterium]|nr:hypothetical protein [Pseudonocardiaceae bacterium]